MIHLQTRAHSHFSFEMDLFKLRFPELLSILVKTEFSNIYTTYAVYILLSD